MERESLLFKLQNKKLKIKVLFLLILKIKEWWINGCWAWSMFLQSTFSVNFQLLHWEKIQRDHVKLFSKVTIFGIQKASCTLSLAHRVTPPTSEKEGSILALTFCSTIGLYLGASSWLTSSSAFYPSLFSKSPGEHNNHVGVEKVKIIWVNK